jgi:hypothetical protein
LKIFLLSNSVGREDLGGRPDEMLGVTYDFWPGLKC